MTAAFDRCRYRDNAQACGQPPQITLAALDNWKYVTIGRTRREILLEQCNILVSARRINSRGSQDMDCSNPHAKLVNGKFDFKDFGLLREKEVFTRSVRL